MKMFLVTFFVRAAAGVSVGDVASYDDEKHVLTIKGDCTVSMSVYAEKTTTDNRGRFRGRGKYRTGWVYIDFYSVDSYDGPPLVLLPLLVRKYPR